MRLILLKLRSRIGKSKIDYNNLRPTPPHLPRVINPSGSPEEDYLIYSIAKKTSIDSFILSINSNSTAEDSEP